MKGNRRHYLTQSAFIPGRLGLWWPLLRAETEEVLLFVVSVPVQLPQRRGASHSSQAPDGVVRRRRVQIGRGQCGRHARRLHEHVGPQEVRTALATSTTPSAAQSVRAPAAGRQRMDDRQPLRRLVAASWLCLGSVRRVVCRRPRQVFAAAAAAAAAPGGRQQRVHENGRL